MISPVPHLRLIVVMSTKYPSSSPTPDGNKPATPPPFATRENEEDEESKVVSLAQSFPASGVPLVTSSEEMRKVYSHFAHLAKDPASLKLPKPKSLHLTLEERAEVDMPIPAHKLTLIDKLLACALT